MRSETQAIEEMLAVTQLKIADAFADLRVALYRNSMDRLDAMIAQTHELGERIVAGIEHPQPSEPLADEGHEVRL